MQRSSQYIQGYLKTFYVLLLAVDLTFHHGSAKQVQKLHLPSLLMASHQLWWCGVAHRLTCCPNASWIVCDILLLNQLQLILCWYVRLNLCGAAVKPSSLPLCSLLNKISGARDITPFIQVTSRDMLILSSDNFSEVSKYFYCLKQVILKIKLQTVEQKQQGKKHYL